MTRSEQRAPSGRLDAAIDAAQDALTGLRRRGGRALGSRKAPAPRARKEKRRSSRSAS
jgi:hypothetical protein